MKSMDNRWFMVLFLVACFIAMGIGNLIHKTKQLWNKLFGVSS